MTTLKLRCHTVQEPQKPQETSFTRRCLFFSHRLLCS